MGGKYYVMMHAVNKMVYCDGEEYADLHKCRDRAEKVFAEHRTTALPVAQCDVMERFRGRVRIVDSFDGRWQSEVELEEGK